MGYLTRYISKTVVINVLVVTLVLMGVQSFLSLIAELDAIGHGHYNLGYALYVVALHMPTYTYRLFPVAGLIGSMIGLGRLASTGELLVMQAAGFSLRKITRAVLLGAIMLMVVMTFCGEWLAPRLNEHADRIKNLAMGKILAISPRSFWLKEGHQYIYMQRMLNPRQAIGGTYFSYNNEGDLKQIVYAQQLQLNGVNQWLWRQGLQATYFDNQHKPYSMPLVTKRIKMTANPHLSSQGGEKSAFLTLPQVYKRMNEAERVGLSSVTLQFDFWHRLFQPLTTLIMICLGVPFIFGALREMHAAVRVMIGVSVGFAFYIMNQVLGPLCLVLQITPWVAAIVPSLLFFMIYILISRQQKKT